jgi:hypothetical protein
MEIFGYDWEDIKSAQQGASLRKRTVSTPKKEATEEDLALLAKYGESGLRERQLFGVMDRLNLPIA